MPRKQSGNHVRQSAKFSRRRSRPWLCARARRALGFGGNRCGDHRRGRGGHRGGAKGRRRGPPLHADRGKRPRRRPLRHRYAHLRGTVRSRRALGALSRHQSGDAACGAQRTRHLSGAAGAEAAHRKAQRARRRDGGLSRDAGAREPRDPGGGARQGRCSLHAGAAEGSGRLAARGGIRARAVHLRQGPR